MVHSLVWAADQLIFSVKLMKSKAERLKKASEGRQSNKGPEREQAKLSNVTYLCNICGLLRKFQSCNNLPHKTNDHRNSAVNISKLTFAASTHSTQRTFPISKVDGWLCSNRHNETKENAQIFGFQARRQTASPCRPQFEYSSSPE